MRIVDDWIDKGAGIGMNIETMKNYYRNRDHMCRRHI